MTYFMNGILVVAGLGFGAVYLAPAASAQDDQCATALNTTAKTRREFPDLATFNERWVRTLNSSNIRDHGWALYQGVVSAAGEGCQASTVPLWLSWATKSELFNPSGPSNLGHQIRLVASTTLGMDQTIQQLIAQTGNPASPAGRAAAIAGASSAVGAASRLASLNALLPGGPFLMPVTGERIFFTTAHYNPAAERSGLTHTPGQLQEAYKHAPSQITDPTPPTAIIVKPIWLPIVPGTALACVPVWNPGATPDDLGAYPPSSWPNQVRVSTNPFKPGETASCNLQQPVPVVSVREFFSMPIDSADSGALTLILPKTLVALAQPSNVALLVGFHVISKEVKSWSWNTYWWEPKSYSDAVPSAGRPKLDPPWDNYVMNASLDEAKIPAADSQGRCDVGAIYNPYQETVLTNNPADPQPVICGKPRILGGLASNCRSCHSLAAYLPPSRQPVVTIQPLTNWLNDYFKDKTRTGFLWSIPNNAFR
jgi:hypothetical protein